MGNSLQNEIDALPDPDNELKVFRQLRAEYFRLTEVEGLSADDAQLLPRLRAAYRHLVDATVPPLPQRAPEAAAWRCPTVRFGRTGLDMPIITCGGMRQQQTWRPKEGTALADVDEDCQRNFQEIVDRAMELGINHFETALGYGTSQLQFGPCLAKYGRDAFILQTKITAREDTAVFRTQLEDSLRLLQVEHVDLLAFHGLNTPQHLTWIFGADGISGCMQVVEEFRRAGRVRWVGFSSHGTTDLIARAIETGRFDYVNLHYHFIGSYTSSGTWTGNGGGGGGGGGGSMMDPSGNFAAVAAAKRHDMGVFIISPNDKGGHLWQPARPLVDACQPQGITPMALNALWLWRHAGTDAPVHTLVVGAARPSDFDEIVAAAKLRPRTAELLPPVEARLRTRMVEALGEDWPRSWWKGLPAAYDTPTGVFVSHIVWLHGLVKAWGMWEYACARYKSLEGNAKNWKADGSSEENLASMNSYTPGMPAAPGVDVAPYIKDCPDAGTVLEVLREAHKWLSSDNETAMRAHAADAGWLAAYTLQPDWPWPERAMHRT